MTVATRVSPERMMKVLLSPVVSEKATFVSEKQNQVVFRVMRDATKPEIKAAVENLFKVQVKSVQVLNRKGKVRRSGKTIGRTNHVRHAYVNLMPGHEINFSEDI